MLTTTYTHYDFSSLFRRIVVVVVAVFILFVHSFIHFVLATDLFGKKNSTVFSLQPKSLFNYQHFCDNRSVTNLAFLAIECFIKYIHFDCDKPHNTFSPPSSHSDLPRFNCRHLLQFLSWKSQRQVKALDSSMLTSNEFEN